MNIDWLTSYLDGLAPPIWAGLGAAAMFVLLAGLSWLKRRFVPKRTQPVRRRRSLADVVTFACATAVLVFAGEGIFEVAQRAAPDVPWLPWLGIGLLEGPLLAFALRAKELIAAGRRDEAGQAIRLTWLFAALSAAISASAALGAGDISLPLIRAAAPIMGVILWHHALAIELNEGGRPQRQTRWKWTPEYLLTRLGLLTARASETADAEVRMRLTKVADWVLRYARLVQRNTGRDRWWDVRWDTFVRWRMERIYRAADRDLDLTRDTARRALLEQIIASRGDTVLLTTFAGVTRADLGLPETGQPEGQPERRTRIVYPKPVERLVRDTRMVFHNKIVERLVERPAPPIHITFAKPVERPGRNTRDTRGTDERDTRNGRGGTPRRNGGTPKRDTSQQDGGGRPGDEEISRAIADAITPSGKVPIRPLAEKLGIPRATLHRHVVKYREGLGITPLKGVIPPPRDNGHSNGHNGAGLAPAGGGKP